MQTLITYDKEGDILDIRWPQTNSPARVGTELNENVVLFTNTGATAALGLMLISYQELVKASRLELTGLRRMPVQSRGRFRRMLRQEPLCRFLRLDAGDYAALKGTQILLTSSGPKLTSEGAAGPVRQEHITTEAAGLSEK